MLRPSCKKSGSSKVQIPSNTLIFHLCRRSLPVRLCSVLLEDYMLPVESDFWQRSRVQELTRRIAAPLICLPAMAYVQNIWGRQNQHRKQKQRWNRKSKLTPQSVLNTEAIPSPWNLSATHLWELQDAFRNWTVQTANPMMAHHTSQIISIFQSRGFLWLPLTEDAPHYSTSSLLINEQKSTNRGRKLNQKPLHQALLPRYPIDLSPVVAWQVHYQVTCQTKDTQHSFHFLFGVAPFFHFAIKTAWHL